MHLYTRPRANLAWLLRPGDHMAWLKLGKEPEPVRSENVYLDADLRDRLIWNGVQGIDTITRDNLDELKEHHSHWPEGMFQRAGGEWTTGNVLIRHTGGVLLCHHLLKVFTRESIELDPWSYVRREGTA